MFADNAKIWIQIKDKHDSGRLQADLEMLKKWPDEWLFRFSAVKCKMMHIEHQQDTSYQTTVAGNMQKLGAINGNVTCVLSSLIT